MSTEQLQQDLDYVVNAVRRNQRGGGVPLIYFMWAAIIAVGWALPDFAPQAAAPFWIVCGIGGGLASWWLGSRDAAARGSRDAAVGRRWALHFLVGAVGFAICWLPILRGAPPQTVVGNFLLVTGLVYALAGVHLDRPLLWSGLLILAGYVVFTLLPVRYVLTITGLIVALALLLAGIASARSRRIPAP